MKENAVMLPVAHLSSNAPGRTRIRILGRQYDETYFAAVQREIEEISDVERVITNASTSSVLVFHHLNFEVLQRHGRESRLFELKQTALQNQPATPIALASASLRKASRGLGNVSAGRFDARSGAFVTLLALGLYQASRGRVLGPASTLLSEAFKLLPLT